MECPICDLHIHSKEFLPMFSSPSDVAVTTRVKMWSAIFLSSTLLLILYAGQANAQGICQSLETCRDCVRTANCVWCKTEVHEDEAITPIRCVSGEYARKQGNSWCPENNIVNEPTFEEIIKNDSLSVSDDKFVQIQPQIVNLKLRIGEKHRLTVRYKQAEDYPVDLYFVTDLTYTMERFKNELSKLSQRIVKAMTSLTRNFRLGFGSFIDKSLRPMVDTTRNWKGKRHYCFRNHFPLTEGHELFQTMVKNVKNVGNSDDPEGGFDGLMQAMVCKEEIGWRSDARHILVYTSDNTPHIAGDGRLAGVPEPNDMQCHLNESGFYTHAELLDYPSIGQIKYTAIEKNVNIIFMVTEQFRNMYENIQSMIPGATLGIFARNSDNIVELIKKYYEDLVKSLTVDDQPKLNFLEMKYYSKCLDKNLTQRNRCDGIRVNDIVEFEVDIKAMACPEREEDWKQTIQIKPDGINEEIIINLELICDCECSQKKNKSVKPPPAKQCSNNGIIKCGICSCDQGHFGKMCQCKGDAGLANSNSSLEAACRSSDSAEICSGRGRCLCGSCNCGQSSSSEYSYYGKFCQCDDFSCRRSSDGKLCGGHGNCVCGTCSCHSGWGGPACECREDTSQCMSPNGNGKVCSDAGTCECGRCMCDKKLGREGRYCGDCPSCPSQRCDEFKDCVECRVHKSGKIYQEDKECNQCLLLDIRWVKQIEKHPNNVEPGVHYCRIAGDDGSTFVFIYVNEDENNEVPTIVAKETKDFPVINDFVAATLGVILLTLLLGLLILLIWKIATHIHDKREFEKFEKQRANPKWSEGENPLFKTAVQTFKNPTHEAVMAE